MKRRTFIEVKHILDGIHSWPEAPNFLKHDHHHQFVIRVRIETIPGDNNRVLEFFDVKNTLRKSLKKLFPERNSNGIVVIGNRSCEMISDLIHGELHKQYPNQSMQIGVTEDDYNGSITYYEEEENEQGTHSLQ